MSDSRWKSSIGIGFVASANAPAVYRHSGRSVTSGATRIPARAWNEDCNGATSNRSRRSLVFRADLAHRFRGTATLELRFDVHLRSRPLEIQGAC